VDLLDEALLRPGRFDYCLEIPQPDEKDRMEILMLNMTLLSREGREEEKEEGKEKNADREIPKINQGNNEDVVDIGELARIV
jgi:SpoVK/Ycf46/Vps4 family AAA+-type ATPase